MAPGALGARTAVALSFTWASLVPSIAAACPYCAGRGEAGVGRSIALGVFIFLPFVLAWAVVRFIRWGEAATAREWRHAKLRVPAQPPSSGPAPQGATPLGSAP